MKQTLIALVENKPGVLNRVASLFRRRNFNIDSLTVGRTESPHISRMTIVVDADAEQVQTQLYKLVNVIQVEKVTDVPNVSRDLALIKVRVDRETRSEVMQLCEIFRAHIVDTGRESVTVEVTGDEKKISSMVEVLQPIGILEMVRTGVVTMARGEHILSPNGYQARDGSNGYQNNVL
ncbi:MAG: acetolactate synthase small subunit [Anaerolineae bacterium]|jgi:acetolactate synthase-1/3 small subunit|nr:acetolactate synthase small subunit [Anaerolineae bacterium]